MHKFQIITDSSCDLSDALIKANNLKTLPFYVTFDSKNYQKEGVELNVRDFYQQMVDNPNVFPKTSQPSAQDYIDAFEPYLADDIPIICLTLTSKMSGSNNSANVALEMCLEKYPNAKITVIDSLTITVLQGLLVLEACRMQNNGLSYDEVVSNIRRIIPTGRIFFTVENLEYLKHGGRIGGLSYIIGNALKVKPIIVFKEGKIFSAGKTLGSKKSILKIIESGKNHLNEIHAKVEDYAFGVGSGFFFDDGIALKAKLIEALGIDATNEVLHFQIGATIAAHTGPYPIGLGFIQKYDA